jgi:hypothetical protein
VRQLERQRGIASVSKTCSTRDARTESLAPRKPHRSKFRSVTAFLGENAMGSLVVSGRAAANWVRRLHAEDEGMETIQIVMVLAVAALVLTGVNGIVGIGTGGEAGGGMMDWVTGALGKVFNSALGGAISWGGDLIKGLF